MLIHWCVIKWLSKDFTFTFVFVIDMGRAMIALFIVGFLFVGIAFFTGVAGCWTRSTGIISATAILMLVACEWSILRTMWYIVSGTILLPIFVLHLHMNMSNEFLLLGFIGLFSAGGMGLWHGVEYYETEKLTGEQYFKDWPQVKNTAK